MPVGCLSTVLRIVFSSKSIWQPNHSLPAQAAGQGSGPCQLGAKMGRCLGRAAQLEAVRLPNPQNATEGMCMDSALKDIDLYFESLEQVYDQILAWKPRGPRLIERLVDWMLGVAAVLFVLSLLPLLPAALMLLARLMPITLGAVNTLQGGFTSFGVLWIALTLLTGIVFFPLLWVNSKVDQPDESPETPPQTLSPEQVSFISAYKAYKELKIFFVSHLDQHVTLAFEALRPLFGGSRYLKFPSGTLRGHVEFDEHFMIRDLGDAAEPDFAKAFDLAVRSPHLATSATLAGDVTVARSFLRTFGRYPWFHMDQGSRDTLQALVSFRSKVPPRLKAREDLPHVLSIVEHLSKFLYAFLPEHRTHIEPPQLERLQSEGSEHLREFVVQVNSFSEYTYPREQPDTSSSKSEVSLRHRLYSSYVRSVFIRFTIWFLLIAGLTSGAVYTFNRIIPLTPDTMATVVIGTSVASAAALAAFLPQRTTPTNNEDT